MANKKLDIYETDKAFDGIIGEFEESAEIFEPNLSPNKITGLERKNILLMMERYGLIERFKNLSTGDSFRLTRFGHEVFRYGGWTHYNDHKSDHENLMRLQIQSTIDSNVTAMNSSKLQRRTNIAQVIILVATFLLSAISVFVSVRTWDSNNKLLEIEAERLNREKNQVIPPAINPSVNVTLQRDTIVVIQPPKRKN